MENLNLKKAIKNIEKQIKEQENVVFNCSKKIEDQKFEEDLIKESNCKLIDDKITVITQKINKNFNKRRIFGGLAAGSLISVMGIFLLDKFFINLNWLGFVCTGILTLFYCASLYLWSKSDKKINNEKQFIQGLYQQKEEIMLSESEDLLVLENEKDKEIKMLEQLNNEYEILQKYSRKKEPKKIEKAKIEKNTKSDNELII